MSINKKGIERYSLGKKILIGRRDNDTLFWLKTDKYYRNPKTDKLNVLEAGKAWIDEESNTLILDFPASDEAVIQKLAKEFLQGTDYIAYYGRTDYYVQLSECSRQRPIKKNDEPAGYIDHDYVLANIEGYILNKDTFLRKNVETGELFYVKFTDYSMNDIENDKFGWIKSAKQFFSISSDEDLLYELGEFKNESCGNAWIDKKNDVVVLGPIYEQRPEASDTHFDNRIYSYLGLYSEWNQTQRWIDIESGMRSNPIDFKFRYFYMLYKCING